VKIIHHTGRNRGRFFAVAVKVDVMNRRDDRSRDSADDLLGLTVT
jgi:hypothetical protein